MAWFTSALLVAAAPPSRGDLVLNEVLYDPDGADEGREFVELWNPDSLAAPLEGLQLETKDGARPEAWTVIWRARAGETAPPLSPVLIPSERLGAALQNGPDAIRLVRGAVVLDLLGYGELADGDSYEAAPADDAPSGASVGRVLDGVDTDVNRDDWAVEREPTPGEANHPDQRLRFGRARPSAVPLVPWPAQPLTVRATACNSGRVTLDKGAWRLVGELESGVDQWMEAAAAAGVTLAPGESASVALSLSGPAPGTHRLRLRLEGAPSGASSSDDGSALADTVVTWLRSVASPVVLSEIAFRNAGAGEWLEIWMREPIADIGALTVADATSGARAIDRGPVPRSMATGSYLVVAQDPPAVRSRYGLADSMVVGVAGGWPPLNDGSSSGGPSDLVAIALLDGVPVDAASYEGTATVRDGSLERLSPDLPSADPGTWSESIHPDGATPGRANSLSAPGGPPGKGGALLVAGARVLRSSGTTPRPIVFRATPAARGRRLTVRVHDLLGRSVRILTEGQRLATDAAFVWDGSDDRGAPAPPGLYIVRAEALPEDGVAPIRSSLSIAIAGGRP